MASTRKPSTPRSNQKRSTSSMAATTSGLRQLRSGCSGEVGVVIELPGPFVEGPGRAAELARPIIGRPAIGASVAPDVPVALGVEARGAAFEEPGMLVGSVVRHVVEDDLEALAMRLVEQAVEILHRAEHRVDAAMIGNVVAEIRHGRGIDRRNPDRVDPERDEMIEPCGVCLRDRRCRPRSCPERIADRSDR